MNILHHRIKTRPVIDIAIDADQHRGQANEAVQDRHQLRHFGHFDFLRQMDADGAADHHRQ